MDNAQTDQSTASLSQEFKRLLAAVRRPQDTSQMGPPPSYHVTLVLSVVLGLVGLDRFYLGRIGTGILKLLTFGGVGIWYLIDVLLLAMGRTKDIAGRPLAGAEDKDRVVSVFLAMTGAFFGSHYFYLGFMRLGFVRLGMGLLFALLTIISAVTADPYSQGTGVLGAIATLIYLVIAVWTVLDLYFLVSGRLNRDAQDRNIGRSAERHQLVALVFSCFLGFYGMDRFYLGHRSLGLLKLFFFWGIFALTLALGLAASIFMPSPAMAGGMMGGMALYFLAIPFFALFFFWYVLDVILIILNALKDENGKPLSPA